MTPERYSRACEPCDWPSQRRFSSKPESPGLASQGIDKNLARTGAQRTPPCGRGQVKGGNPKRLLGWSLPGGQDHYLKAISELAAGGGFTSESAGRSIPTSLSSLECPALTQRRLRKSVIQHEDARP